MDIPGIERFVSDIVSRVLRHDTERMSFTEVYFRVFQDNQAANAEVYWQCLNAAFGDVLNMLKGDVLNADQETFSYQLIEFCKETVRAVKDLAALFRTLERSPYCHGLKIEKELMNVMKRVMFDGTDVANNPKIEAFLKIFAHSLPGNPHIEAEIPMLKMILNLVSGTKKWNLFAEELKEATDALTIEFTSAMIRKQECQENVLVYLGAVMSLRDHEETFWELLSADIRVELRRVFLKGVIWLVSDFLGSPASSRMLGKVFFDDFANLDLLDRMIGKIFDNPECLEVLAMALVDYVVQKFNDIKAAVDPKKPLSVVSAKQIVEPLIDIMMRLNVLSMRVIGRSKALNCEGVQNLMYQFISDSSLRIEQSLCIYIGNAIEIIFNEADKEAEQWLLIQRCVELARFIFDKQSFVPMYTHAMMIRLCRCAGQQYRLEESVINMLQPYFPPVMSVPLEEKMKEFEKSDAANKLWVKHSPASRMRVFLVPEKVMHLKSSFKSMCLPQAFKTMQQEYEHFCQTADPIPGASKLKFSWVYEDNLVQMRLQKPGCYDISLKAPIFFAAVLLFIHEKISVTLGELSRLMNMPNKSKLIETIIKKGTAKEFPIFNYRVQDPIENSLAILNPSFTTKRTRFVIQLAARFSLKEDAQQVPAQASAAPVAEVNVNMYRAAIIRVMKRTRRLEEGKLFSLVQDVFRGFPDAHKFAKFSREDFTRILYALEKEEFVERGGTAQRPVWQYIP